MKNFLDLSLAIRSNSYIWTKFVAFSMKIMFRKLFVILEKFTQTIYQSDLICSDWVYQTLFNPLVVGQCIKSNKCSNSLPLWKLRPTDKRTNRPKDRPTGRLEGSHMVFKHKVIRKTNVWIYKGDKKKFNFYFIPPTKEAIN